jgi:hypothetical protein
MTDSDNDMTEKQLFISADEHVQEHPEVWTKRMSRTKWGERIPHVERGSTGMERWLVDGREIDLAGVADCGAAMAQRTRNPQRWADVPTAVYDPQERLKAMDEAGIDYAVLYPTVAGVGGQAFGRIQDAELELSKRIMTGCSKSGPARANDSSRSASRRFIRLTLWSKKFAAAWPRVIAA